MIVDPFNPFINFNLKAEWLDLLGQLNAGDSSINRRK